MTFMEWALWAVLVSIYVVCLFTVCSLTFRKGHTALGFIGLILPILWLIGAVLPAREGSTYEYEQSSRVHPDEPDPIRLANVGDHRDEH
jgi:hypothetical protein